jgi:hypothetical protein
MQFSERKTDIYVFHRVQISSGEKPDSYEIGAGPFLGNIAAGIVKLTIHINPVTVQEYWSFTSAAPICLHAVIIEASD